MTLTDPAPGQPTRLAQLIELGKHVDSALQPSLADLPATVAALIYQDLIGPAIEKADPNGTLPEVQTAVAHAIQPPDPNASNATFKGVDPEQYNSLKAELEQIRQELAGVKATSTTSSIDPLSAIKREIADLRGHHTPTPETAVDPEPADVKPDAMSTVTDPDQQELLELRSLVDRLQAQQAAGQHPTADSIPES